MICQMFELSLIIEVVMMRVVILIKWNEFYIVRLLAVTKLLLLLMFFESRRNFNSWRIDVIFYCLQLKVYVYAYEWQKYNQGNSFGVEWINVRSSITRLLLRAVVLSEK